MQGEVHLENLEEVPQNSLKIGYSEKSANDILNYITNLNEHDLAYCLHSNDCRHFLNKICEVRKEGWEEKGDVLRQ